MDPFQVRDPYYGQPSDVPDPTALAYYDPWSGYYTDGNSLLGPNGEMLSSNLFYGDERDEHQSTGPQFDARSLPADGVPQLFAGSLDVGQQTSTAPSTASVLSPQSGHQPLASKKPRGPARQIHWEKRPQRTMRLFTWLKAHPQEARRVVGDSIDDAQRDGRGPTVNSSTCDGIYRDMAHAIFHCDTRSTTRNDFAVPDRKIAYRNAVQSRLSNVKKIFQAWVGTWLKKHDVDTSSGVTPKLMSLARDEIPPEGKMLWKDLALDTIASSPSFWPPTMGSTPAGDHGARARSHFNLPHRPSSALSESAQHANPTPGPSGSSASLPERYQSSTSLPESRHGDDNPRSGFVPYPSPRIVSQSGTVRSVRSARGSQAPARSIASLDDMSSSSGTLSFNDSFVSAQAMMRQREDNRHQRRMRALDQKILVQQANTLRELRGAFKDGIPLETISAALGVTAVASNSPSSPSSSHPNSPSPLPSPLSLSSLPSHQFQSLSQPSPSSPSNQSSSLLSENYIAQLSLSPSPSFPSPSELLSDLPPFSLSNYRSPEQFPAVISPPFQRLPELLPHVPEPVAVPASPTQSRSHVILSSSLADWNGAV